MEAVVFPSTAPAVVASGLRSHTSTGGGGVEGSARFDRIHPSSALWQAMEDVPGQTVSREWIHFVAETQKAVPVVAELRHGSDRLGFFTGLIVRKLGLRILGSPFPGWMTPYMGFTLYPGVPRAVALVALERFAFQELGCVHVEIMDRHLTVQDVDEAGYAYSVVGSYETDLRQSEERLLAAMKSACRRCIRKADKSGVLIEEARGEDTGFVEDYYAQLKEGLLGKGIVPSYNAALVRKLVEHLFSSGRLLLLRARDPDGRCIATGVYPAMNGTAHLWGNVASYSWSRHLRPSEALNWYAMRYWKARGVERFDWGGVGRYKEKYGGAPIAVLRVRKSRSSAVGCLRQLAENALRRRLRVQGRFMAWWNRRLANHR
jgi:hypothetical protein